MEVGGSGSYRLHEKRGVLDKGGVKSLQGIYNHANGTKVKPGENHSGYQRGIGGVSSMHNYNSVENMSPSRPLDYNQINRHLIWGDGS